MDSPADLRCNEIVELVTDYVEGALDDQERTRFELHVIACRGCANYVEQMREAALAGARDAPEDPDPEQVAELLDAFRSWHRRTLEEG